MPSKTQPMPQYAIKRFDPSKISDDSICFVVGRRGSGKTTLVTYLAFCKRHIERGVCCSATERANMHWSYHIPSTYIHTSYEETLTESLINIQNNCAQSEGKENLRSVFAIYDDIMYDQSFPRQKASRELFMNGRHYKIFLLLTAQYCMDLPPALRTNVDYIFILKEPIRSNKVKLYNNFGGIFPKFDHFEQALGLCTEDYNCMVIDNTTVSNSVEDVVSVFKAPRKIHPFRMGSSVFWAGAPNADIAECEGDCIIIGGVISCPYYTIAFERVELMVKDGDASRIDNHAFETFGEYQLWLESMDNASWTTSPCLWRLTADGVRSRIGGSDDLLSELGEFNNSDLSPPDDNETSLQGDL